MTARGAGILGSVTFVLLLGFGSYLLDVPPATVLIGAAFAIGVILWVGTRDAASGARSFSSAESTPAGQPDAPREASKGAEQEGSHAG